MTTAPLSHRFDRFPLARLLILILAGGFVGLMLDIRVEHVEVVRERSVAWLPIIFSGIMSVACVLAFVLWRKSVSMVMIPLFLLAMLVGALGFYFHNHGRVMQVARTSLAAWTDPNMNHSDSPPQFAPLAFAGLGVVGVLASLKRIGS